MVIYANEQEKYEISEKLTNEIEDCILETLENHGITDETETSVMFTDNEGIREINRQTRNIDKPTDVLSFPQYEFSKLGVIEKEEWCNKIILGDIVLSLEKAEEQAKEYGHSFEREVGYLCVHSMLHLLGYDHMTEEDKKIMRAKEEEILNEIGLTREEN